MRINLSNEYEIHKEITKLIQEIEVKLCVRCENNYTKDYSICRECECHRNNYFKISKSYAEEYAQKMMVAFMFKGKFATYDEANKNDTSDFDKISVGDKVKIKHLYIADNGSGIEVGDVGTVNSITILKNATIMNVKLDNGITNEDLINTDLGTYPFNEEQIEKIK